jgi:hypothetical protein
MEGNNPRRFPYFLLAGDLVENAPIGSPFLFGHLPKCIRYFVSVAEKFFCTLWAFTKELPMPFRHCSNSLQELLGAFSNVSQH